MAALARRRWLALAARRRMTSTASQLAMPRPEIERRTFLVNKRLRASERVLLRGVALLARALAKQVPLMWPLVAPSAAPRLWIRQPESPSRMTSLASQQPMGPQKRHRCIDGRVMIEARRREQRKPNVTQVTSLASAQRGAQLAMRRVSHRALQRQRGSLRSPHRRAAETERQQCEHPSTASGSKTSRTHAMDTPELAILFPDSQRDRGSRAPRAEGVQQACAAFGGAHLQPRIQPCKR